MSCHPCIAAKVSYGLEAERKLLPILSDVIGEPLIKTVGTFDCMDMEGLTSFSELKRRTTDYTYEDERIKREGWWMPSCKVIKGWQELSEGKRVFFFYLWSCDKSLWMYEMKEGDFSSSDCHKVPKGHYDNQLHVAIPQERWTRVECDLSSLVFEEDLCWIS
jgi:hypothetical protein